MTGPQLLARLKRAFFKRFILPRALEGIGVSSPTKKAFTEDVLAKLADTSPDKVAEAAVSGEKTWPLVATAVVAQRTKAQALIAASHSLLAHAMGNPDMESKLVDATAAVAAQSGNFQKLLREALYREVPSWPIGLLGDTKNFARLNLLRGKADWARMQGWLALHRFLGAITPWLDPSAVPPELEYTLCLAVKDERELRHAFHAAICGDGHLPLALGRVRLPDAHSFWPQLFEIFINEDYAFDAGTDTPNIIDAGMHMGLATYYFKAKYPQARITAFEPSPTLRAIAEENVSTCNFAEVQIEPYALSDSDGELQFYVDAEDTMAGSISVADGKQPITRGDASPKPLPRPARGLPETRH